MAPPQPPTTESPLLKTWLLLTNLTMSLAWARVLAAFLLHPVSDEPVCQEQLSPVISAALWVSFLELFNAMAGFTRSKPHQVLLFATVRFGVEKIVAPLIPCASWQHVLATSSWALGDTIRFACFAVDNLLPTAHWAKAVRYTVGPMLFPLGASGEMFMVLATASEGRQVKAYLAAMCWPPAFWYLYQQLLRQRKKYFAKRGGDQKKAEIKMA